MLSGVPGSTNLTRLLWRLTLCDMTETPEVLVGNSEGKQVFSVTRAALFSSSINIYSELSLLNSCGEPQRWTSVGSRLMVFMCSGSHVGRP